MPEKPGPKRALDKKKIAAIDRALNKILSKNASVPEFLSKRRAELEKAVSYGYTHKELANIFSDTAKIVITQADIKRALISDDGEGQDAKIEKPWDIHNGGLPTPPKADDAVKATGRKKPQKPPAE